MECCLNFLNIEKNKILRIFFFQYFMFSSRFMLKKKLRGEGVLNFLLEKQSFSFHVLCYFLAFHAISNIKEKKNRGGEGC